MNLCNINEVKALLGRHGFHFSKSLGQNFLIQSWVPEDIAASSGATPDKAVLEIGPGIGPLTTQLAKRAGKVVAIELDSALLPILDETLSEFSNTKVIYGDVMKIDLKKIVSDEMDGLSPIVCANLPYNITTPVITLFLESGLFETITVMIQKEVAQRICAKPGSSDFGAFSLLCQYYANCEYLFEVPKECFLPAPKVTSAVVNMKLLNEKPVIVKDEALMFRVIRAAFAQRRKTLSNALGSAFSNYSKTQINDAIIAADLEPGIRGEKLGLIEFARLSDCISELIST